MEPLSVALIGASLLLAIGLAAWPASRAGRPGSTTSGSSWPARRGDHGLPPATGRIELADLKERVRKLEAIAAGIDL